jgi:hypothetical protein
MTVPAGKDQTRKEEGSSATAVAARQPSTAPQELRRLAEMYKAKLQSWTESYQQEWPRSYRAKIEERVEASLATRGNGDRVAAAAEPDSEFFGITYPWWNILVLGPFQTVAPGGPFRPSKIIRTGEDAFMIVVLWRNPVPLPGGPNPSAAQIMASYEWEVRGETINLSDVTDGPDLAPATGTFGAGFIDVFLMPIPPGTFTVPAQGRPLLYELNFVMDIKGVGPGLPPFAGYATWVFDPDTEPPFLFVPEAPAGLQHDIPVRFLVYS